MEMCGSPLWDLAVTWRTTDPDFTPCFHKTVLVYTPALFLLLLAPLELHFQRTSHSRRIPWRVLNIARLTATLLLLVVSVIELGLTITSPNRLYISDILSPIVKLFTFTFALLLAIGNLKMGIQSSGILFSFWAISTVAGAITFASTIRFGDTQGQVINDSIFSVEFGLVAALFFLHFWADPSPLEKSLLQQNDQPSPVVGASFPSKITFNWLNDILTRGWKSALTKADLYSLNPSEQTKVIFSEWDKHWRKSEEKNRKKQGRPPTSIFKPLLFTFGLSLLSCSLIQLITVLLTQVSPQALNLLIGFISSGEEQWKGYLYMVYLVGINLIITILNSQYFLEQMLIGLRIRAAMTSALFRKSLRLSSKSRKERSVGETVNLMQIDTQRMMDVIQSLNLLWSSPVTIFLSIYSLWGLLGPSCLAGLLVMVLLIPSNAVLGSKMKQYQRQNMRFKDLRMKTMNEVLDGIKVLKLYAWEPSFQAQVEDIRNTEVNNLKKLSYLRAVQSFLFNAAPVLVAVASFGTYVLVDPANILDAQIAFVSLSYFNIMRRPLNQLPQLVVSMIQAQVSWDRLNAFLNASEINQNNVTHEEDGDTVVSMEHGSFTWDKELAPTLTNIHLDVGRGELVAVVGKVGSGKSSLLSALTNDMEKAGLRARANVCGAVSYVPQQAWMQNASLQYNITFGRRYNEKMYNRVLDACALRPDLEILPNGDRTEIGEKGINLSGGQKQRVSLARAVYNNGDVYLLDDPLSAVDAHVGKHLFEQVIGPTGLLKNKTRILVTHGVKFLPMVDRIVVLRDGAVSEIGSYKELLAEGKEFADFLIEYIQDEEGKVIDGEELEALKAVKGDLEHAIGSEKLNVELRKARSVRSAHSNISGYRSDATEATLLSKVVSKAVIDVQNPQNKSLVDEKTPLRKRGGGEDQKHYGANGQKAKKGEARGMDGG
jgi:ATP-binding cassette subfamily C (CFTR/MRP) protein 1